MKMRMEKKKRDEDEDAKEEKDAEDKSLVVYSSHGRSSMIASFVLFI